MAKYRKVDPRIWNDAKFRGLSDDGKLVFFFLLTHPNTTALGAMRGTIPGLAAEIGWTEKAFREAFREALSKGMAKHDEEASFFWLPNFMKYNRPESPNVVKAWVNSVDNLPECNLLYQAITAACECAESLGKAFVKALPKDFGKSMPYQEQEQEQEQEYKEDLRSSVGQDSPTPSTPVPYAAIVSKLNEVCGCQFKADSQATRRHIKARWNEGWRLPDFEAVIRAKHEEWATDAKMCAFLRPETLFGTKFESYLQLARNGRSSPVSDSTAPTEAEQAEWLRKIKAARAESERKEREKTERIANAAPSQ
jgi:uncharacterized phage protein (TIGR02220 family)